MKSKLGFMDNVNVRVILIVFYENFIRIKIKPRAVGCEAADTFLASKIHKKKKKRINVLNTELNESSAAARCPVTIHKRAVFCQNPRDDIKK